MLVFASVCSNAVQLLVSSQGHIQKVTAAIVKSVLVEVVTNFAGWSVCEQSVHGHTGPGAIFFLPAVRIPAEIPLYSNPNIIIEVVWQVLVNNRNFAMGKLDGNRVVLRWSFKLDLEHYLLLLPLFSLPSACLRAERSFLRRASSSGIKPARPAPIGKT